MSNDAPNEEAQSANSQNSDQEDNTKNLISKKKKLDKAARIAQRTNGMNINHPKLKHPDDAEFGDIMMNQSAYRVCQILYHP